VLKWLKEFLWIVMLIFFGELVPVFLVPFKLNPLLYIPLVDSAMFYLLVFKAIGNPMVFMKLGVIDELIRETKNNKTFMLKETDVQVMREQLNRVIEGKELFYKPEMSLAYLSGKLKIPEHHLTQLLNKIYKCNFNELVNSIRVEEVKKRLNNPDFNKLTIEGIGESVGFTSRITFHKVFKRFTQLTPLEYKKKSNQ
jgi:YesN/AraC family two-component response regulator